MRVIKPSYEILTDITEKALLTQIESAGRTCYKSEDKITDLSAIIFTQNLIKRGHEAMIEFADITVKFIHNRGFTHELVRHRLASFAQESTRYCDYSKGKFGGELTFIEPYWFSASVEDSIAVIQWVELMDKIEEVYLTLVSTYPAQAIRGILPNDIKTEIVMKANVREWRHLLQLRTSEAAHPDMCRVMKPLLAEFKEELPTLFSDIN
jgi:thymidylate synthase (FAD)